jgi:hypothetical protein
VSEYEEDEGEVVDGLPVVAEPRTLEAAAARPLVPARQAAALAAGGFVAGAATVAVASRAPRLVRRGRKSRKGVVGEILSSNSFLVDVHLVRRG